MLSEAESERSTITGDSKESLSVHDRGTRATAVDVQQQKMQALRNLHQIIQSKDNELRATREKAQNLQAALDKAEMRLANQIRMAATSGSFKSVQESDAEAQKRKSTDDKKRAVTDDQRAIWVASDIEADGCANISSVIQEKESPCSPKIFSVPISESSKSEHLTSVSSSDTKSDKSSVLQGRGIKTSASSTQSLTNADTSFDGAEKVSMSSATSMRFAGGAGVSKDLLEKLIQQNARLKKVIRDILNQKGMTIENYLDNQETQDVVKQLREELRLSKAQNDRLKEILSKKDNEDVLKKYVELSENFQKLKRTATMLQAMVDAYSKEYEKLQQENKELKEQLSSMSMASMKQKSVEVTELKQLGNRAQSVDAGSDDTISSSALGDLRLQLDEALIKVHKLESESESLRTQCESQSEKLVQWQRENSMMETLKEQFRSLESEKVVLQNQIALYQEDFAAEHTEYMEKQQQYEANIMKHQDWIKRLHAESQTNRNLYEEEKVKRHQAETKLNELQSRFRKFVMDSRPSNQCSDQHQQPWNSFYPQLNDLQMDFPQSSAASSSSSLPTDLNRFGGDVHCVLDLDSQATESSYVCPRCEREFERTEEKKFKDHCARCTDD